MAVPIAGLTTDLIKNTAIEAQQSAEARAYYIQPTGEVVGLDSFLPRLLTFTRGEVLMILRALKADTGVAAGKEALDRAVRVFERME
jgi:hypothetical protein